MSGGARTVLPSTATNDSKGTMMDDTTMVDSATLVALCGATYRQTDAWAQSGLFGDGTRTKPGSGYRRRFSPLDVMLATIAVKVSPWSAGGHRTDRRPDTVDMALAVAWCSAGSQADMITVDLTGHAHPFDDLAVQWQRLDRPTLPAAPVLVVPLEQPVPARYMALLADRIRDRRNDRASGGGS